LVDSFSSGQFEVVERARGKPDSPHSITMVSDKAPIRTGLKNDSTWFLEGTVPGKRWGNVNHGFAINELVLKERTQFQECLIFENPVYGRVLVLDGIVQLSTFDEHIYHEMLVHPPMFTHPDPERVVIVGGGDGGTLREVLQHNPKEVVLIDIDEQFVRAATKHLPSLSAGAFEDPRVTFLFEDASEALLRYAGIFDVAIIDCNDAIGPSRALFEENFYATVTRALKDGGVCSLQAGSMLETVFLQQTYRRVTTQLGCTTGFRLTIPCYHCGEYVFMVASKSGDPSGPDSTTLSGLQVHRGVVTKYWSPVIHHASQALPPKSTLW
jgi:spermidine synthase